MPDRMTQLTWVLPLLFAWVVSGLPQSAIAQTVIGGFSHCEAFERSLLLANRQNALHAEVRRALLEFDRQRALKPGAVDATGVDSPHCERLLSFAIYHPVESLKIMQTRMPVAADNPRKL